MDGATPTAASDAIDFEHHDPAPPQGADGLPIVLKKYTVEAGDSVRTIAKQFGVSNETVIWENDLTDPDLLQVGQVLKILPYSGLIHEVQPGDTVASIANTYEAKINDIIRENRLQPPYIIVVGQKVVVPNGYRPLPQKVTLAPAPPAQADTSAAAPPANTVRAPDDGSQQAAVQAPIHSLPQLGNTPQEQFIGSIAQAAVDSYNATGIPASVTIAQAILESYWGSSRLAREANNYFGIKAQTKPGPAGVTWMDVWEVIGGRNVVQTEPFRVYSSIAQSFTDHAQFFLENGRYAAALAARKDARQFAIEINRAGYATDPSYSSKLIGLMDRYNLYRYDQ